ncbi:hypothetical protein [Pseudofrankia sp. BMG5.37]|uniref:hypothetical protein n=1 Tax=Pseudofrankia sp. BMG5.37 TaxID=3050035 RepID=UPI0028946EDC|nr:hypothetical protein [Pseudofrankia sp. BMG5.37]MDT3443347.1 hypothetical protein [Pseudofrankia sp. BMG5.37]
MRWDDLPPQVREAVEAQTGPVTSTKPVDVGNGCDLAVVAETAGRRLFVKAVEGDGRRARWLSNEHESGHLAAGVAPTPLFAVDTAGWLLVAFDHADGRPADLTPGSADLPRIGEVLDELGRRSGDGLRPLSDRWRRSAWWDDLRSLPADAVPGFDVAMAATLAVGVSDAVAGDRLLHTDLHAHQFLVAHDRIWVVDWGWPAQGAPWVDAAFMAIRLIGAGHSPTEAEQWAAGLACWTVTPEALTAFASQVAGLWTYRAVESSDQAMRWRAALARRYAASRMPALTT